MNWRRWAARPQYVAVIALVVLVALNAAFTPNFATAGNLWNVLLQVSTVVLTAVGMTFVIATGGVDLSVGSTMAIAAAIGAVLADRGALIAIVAALAGASLVGALNGALIASLRAQPIVVTLATLIGGRGLAQIISRDGELVSVGDPVLLALGRGHLGPVPLPAVLALMAAIILVPVYLQRPARA